MSLVSKIVNTLIKKKDPTKDIKELESLYKQPKNEKKTKNPIFLFIQNIMHNKRIYYIYRVITVLNML